MKKILITFVALFAIVHIGSAAESSEEEVKFLVDVFGSCSKEVGAGEEDYKPMAEHECPTTDKGKCLVACINKNLTIMTEGTLNLGIVNEIATELYDKDTEDYKKAVVVAEDCKKCIDAQEPTDDCDLAFKLCKCCKEAADAHDSKTPVGNLSNFIPVDFWS